LKILITGGAGYLGSVMTPSFLDQGHEVTVLDNLMYGQRTSLLACCNRPGFDFVRGDVRDERILNELIPRHDVLIPLAAISGAPACDRDPVLARQVNQEAVETLNRLRSPQQRVIFPCTNSGYGTRSGEMFCTEESALEPISVYGITKVAAEKSLLESPNTLTLRLATVFGVSPRMRLELLVNQFAWKALVDGYLVLYEKHFKRNYLHIQDAADGFAWCLDHFEDMKGTCYNLGLQDANLSKEELAVKIKQHVPHLYIHSAEVGRDPDQRNYIVSNEKMRLAGFEARRSLDEGLRQLLVSYRMLRDLL